MLLAPALAKSKSELRAGDAVAVVRDVLRRRGSELDYLDAKLAFDGVIDSTTDVAWVRSEIDKLCESATNLARGDSRAAVRLGAVRTVIYESGPWNDCRPFSYDMTDPEGRHRPNALLQNYLRNRVGQCVSMPILFVILAERLGLNVALCSAPEHILVRYVDEFGQHHNIEASSGGHPARDEWVRQQFNICDRAIESGIYLRTLSKREGIATLAHTIVEHLREEGEFQQVVSACKCILQHHTRDISSLISLASAYGLLLDRFRKQHPNPFFLRPEQAAHGYGLVEQNTRLFAIAESMGWAPLGGER